MRKDLVAVAAFTARQCPVCEKYVDVRGEGDTTTSDRGHWMREHETDEYRAREPIGYPFFPWNEATVLVYPEAYERKEQA